MDCTGKNIDDPLGNLPVIIILLPLDTNQSESNVGDGPHCCNDLFLLVMVLVMDDDNDDENDEDDGVMCIMEEEDISPSLPLLLFSLRKFCNNV